MVGIGLQDWPCIKTALGKCNLSNLAFKWLIGRPSLDRLPAFQSTNTRNEASPDMYTIEPTSIHT